MRNGRSKFKSIGCNPGLLVSVRDANEASVAFSAEVDIVDIKEPANGPLGMADEQQIKSILSIAPAETRISVALGELHQLTNSRLARSIQLLVESGMIRYAKIGLSGMSRSRNWRSQWEAVLANLPLSVERVAVAYADVSASLAPSPAEIIDAGAKLNCGTVLIDTFDKSQGDVFEHLGIHDLEMLRNAAVDNGMRFVLAGSINVDSLQQAVQVGPDLIGVRGAVCRRANRENEICFESIVELKNRLRQITKIRILN